MPNQVLAAKFGITFKLHWPSFRVVVFFRLCRQLWQYLSNLITLILKLIFIRLYVHSILVIPCWKKKMRHKDHWDASQPILRNLTILSIHQAPLTSEHNPYWSPTFTWLSSASSTNYANIHQSGVWSDIQHLSYWLYTTVYCSLIPRL